MRPILYKYILKEMWPPFLSSLLVFGLIMIATRMLSIMDWIVNWGVSPIHAMKLIIYLLPNVLFFALPAAGLIAVLMAFLRLSEDNEIIALNSSGISLFQLLPPVLYFAIAGSLLAALISFFSLPWGNKAFKNGIYQIIQEEGQLSIKERLFCEPFDDVVFYINHMSPKEKVMRDLFVVDKRDQSVTNTIIAREGRIFRHPKSKSITLSFEDGTIFIVGKEFKNTRTIKFANYDLNIRLKDFISSKVLKISAPKEMNIYELMANLNQETEGSKRYNELSIRLHENFSVPLAVFLMAMLAAPLGARIRASARSFGIILGLLVFLMYYLCFMGVRSLSETGSLPPFLGIWIPDFLLSLFCIFLWWKESKGGSVVSWKFFMFNIRQ